MWWFLFGYWCRGRCRRLATGHPLNICNHMIQCRVVSKNKFLIHWQTELLTDVSHDFSLLDGINPEFSFQVLIEFYKVCRVSCVLDNHVDYSTYNITLRLAHRW